MRAEIDWLVEIIKAACVILMFVFFMGWVGNMQNEIFVEDCEATGFYRAGDTVIECNVRAGKESGNEQP